MMVNPIELAAEAAHDAAFMAGSGLDLEASRREAEAARKAVAALIQAAIAGMEQDVIDRKTK